MSDAGFSGIQWGPLMTKFLVRKHSYYYGTNTKTEHKRLASHSCKAHSDPLKFVEEMKENTEGNFAHAEAILFTLDITHMRKVLTGLLQCHEIHLLVPGFFHQLFFHAATHDFRDTVHHCASHLFLWETLLLPCIILKKVYSYFAMIKFIK